MITPPAPDHLPSPAAELAAEYTRLSDDLRAAEAQLGQLHASTDQARLDDARALSDAARNGANPASVGTPAQANLADKIKQQTTVVEALRNAVADVETELTAALKAHGQQGIEDTLSLLEQLQAPYLDLIDQVQQAALDYDRALYTLAGWAHLIDTNGRDVAFSYNGGSIPLRNGGPWLMPVDLPEITKQLREHAARHKAIAANVGLDRKHREDEARIDRERHEQTLRREAGLEHKPRDRYVYDGDGHLVGVIPAAAQHAAADPARDVG